MADNSIIESSTQYIPKDLAITSQPDSVDKDKFKVVATGLKTNSGYAFQFQYVFEDGETSEWSPGYFVSSTTEQVPSAPIVSITGGAGFIQVTLPTFPSNASRVDVRIAGGIFGDGTKVADSFYAAGTKTIAAPGSASPGLEYIVTLLTVTPTKINGDPSAATTVYVTDPSATLAVTSPQDPFAPTVRAGLAAVIVEWSGKKSDGTDLTTTGFSGAKVHIGTTAGFTPSSDNWVHTLNFANGSNRVSIGVGSIINKTAGTTLQYGTEYYIKLVTVNANGVTSGTVSASNNPVTVAKLPASEISTGILTADASITAGIDGGARVVMSGSSNPLIIYGTDGSTELLKFTGGATGTLTINGGGTFTGNLSAGSGSSIFKSDTSGIYLGNESYLLAPFKVSRTGNLTAQSGTIGGWTITGSLLHSSSALANKIELNPATPKISLLQSGVEKITIDPIEGIKDASGNFVLTPDGSLTLKGSFSLGNNSNNFWTSSGGFRAGGANTFASINVSTGTTLLYSADTTTDNTDGSGNTSIMVPQKIEVTSTEINIQGIPGNGNELTAYGDLLGPLGDGVANTSITQYRSAGYVVPGNEPSATYGSAARHRLIIADPYDYNKLKRGFGIYYGVRASGNAPSSTAGFVGDLWVSW
jgi:hypothetical protein